MTIEKQNEINAQHSSPLRRLRNWATAIGCWLASPWVVMRKSQRLWRAKMRLEALLSLEYEGEGSDDIST